MLQNTIGAYSHGISPQPSKLTGTHGYIGETIEQRVKRILNNREPITDGAPQIYTERSEGVKPEHNIRTDRFELALDMTIQMQQNAQNKRRERAEQRTKANAPGEPTPIPATTPAPATPNPTPGPTSTQ